MGSPFRSDQPHTSGAFHSILVRINVSTYLCAGIFCIVRATACFHPRKRRLLPYCTAEVGPATPRHARLIRRVAERRAAAHGGGAARHMLEEAG
eukprot:6214467-Pleurochrysis_carterae.AAC.7